MRIGSVVLALAGANALTGRAATALAAVPRCEGVRVRGAPDLTPDWADAVRRLVSELPPVADAACAAITLSVEPASERGARLAAMAADGRYAERVVPRPSSLAAMALGLVASIPGEPEEVPDAGATPVPSAPTAAAPPAPPPASLADAGVPAPAQPPQQIEVSLGLGVGARVGEPTPVEMVDFEGRADVLVTRWVLALSLRYAASLGPDNSDVSYEEIDLGLGAGRRLALGRSALDLCVLPSLATMNLRLNPDGGGAAQSGSSAALRLGASARWSAPISVSWRFTITADTDLSPAGLEHPVHVTPAAPPLPAWTAGLRVGASGALL